MCRRAVPVLLVVSLVMIPASFVTMAWANPKGPNGGPNGGSNGSGSEQCAEADEGDNLHPSGKDRSCEPGGSGTQGSSPSEPDGDWRGPDRMDHGVDKPGQGGGLDPSDQEGNNGCGNDDDFEDDNEGWCGGNPKRQERAGAVEAEAPGRAAEAALRERGIAGIGGKAPLAEIPGALVLGAGAEAVVLGVKIAGAAGAQVLGAAAELPTTGVAAISLALLGASLVTLGALVRRRSPGR